MTDCKISVLLPIYNGGSDLLKAVQSILAQDLPDFEIIAINDGSSDHSAEVLNSIADPRLKVFHQDNSGLAATLNRALSLASSNLVARQDQDDLSMPGRFSAQWKYMDLHEDCSLLGTAAEIWEGDNPTSRAHDHPIDHAQLSFELLFNNPFVHSSVMMRRDFVLSLGGYTVDPARQPPEDYELWSRMARSGQVANLAEHLLVYREVPSSMSRTGPNPFLNRLVLLSSENIAFACGLATPDETTNDIAALTHSAYHLLSSKPNLAKMKECIIKAAKGISEDNKDINQRLSTHLHRIEYQWLIHRGNLGWARSKFSRLKKFFS